MTLQPRLYFLALEYNYSHCSVYHWFSNACLLRSTAVFCCSGIARAEKKVLVDSIAHRPIGYTIGPTSLDYSLFQAGRSRRYNQECELSVQMSPKFKLQRLHPKRQIRGANNKHFCNTCPLTDNFLITDSDSIKTLPKSSQCISRINA